MLTRINSDTMQLIYVYSIYTYESKKSIELVMGKLRNSVP